MDSVIYKSVRGTWLRDRNEKTKKLWDDSLTLKDEDGHPMIVDVTSDKEDPMFMVIDHRFEHLLGLCEDPKDPYGIENVNFSLIGLSDDRWDKYKKQRLTRGFDNSELWNLNSTICGFVLPRLEAFRESAEGCCPGWCENSQQWMDVLDKMIAGFKAFMVDELSLDKDEREKVNKTYKEGLETFAKHFGSLWI